MCTYIYSILHHSPTLPCWPLLDYQYIPDSYVHVHVCVARSFQVYVGLDLHFLMCAFKATAVFDLTTLIKRKNTCACTMYSSFVEMMI